MLTLLNSSFNFPLYCSMSRQFRETFLSLFWTHGLMPCIQRLMPCCLKQYCCRLPKCFSPSRHDKPLSSTERLDTKLPRKSSNSSERWLCRARAVCCRSERNCACYFTWSSCFVYRPDRCSVLSEEIRPVSSSDESSACESLVPNFAICYRRARLVEQKNYENNSKTSTPDSKSKLKSEENDKERKHAIRAE
ncbi:unnamed protein product [Protopolystoma xenopodis]|uniref:Uncharacterized protein n=1 Tax=Protopolystoma xenopodis TaxID=117903 RepID=A0A3S5CLF6_9PLAT|nr:unnamed protein product [Protopolystoma xenopodis]